MAVPDLCIVIPTLGRSPALPHVLAGLRAQAPALSGVEVVIVIDADGVQEPVLALGDEKHGFPVTVLVASTPGASAARNLGWEATSAPLVLFLDDDVVPRPRLVFEHRDWHRLDPSITTGVLGLVCWAPGVTVTPFMRWLEMGIQFDYGTIAGVEVGWQRFYSCNVSVKREMLQRTGGFDAQRFPYGYEDLELARRMYHDHGFRLRFNRDAVGDHLKSETLASWQRNLKRIAIAERRFVELYPSEEPYFHNRFAAAAAAPRARGRSARLARWVAPWVPWLGPIVWRSFDMVCSQRLAPEFLREWEEANRRPAVPDSNSPAQDP